MSPRATMDSPLRRAAARHAQRTALVCGDRSWTYQEFDRLVDRIAGGLAAKLEAGARVGLFMKNRPEYLFLQCAIERAGLVRVPLNARYTAFEVPNLLDDSGAEALFHDQGTSTTLEAALSSLPHALWRCCVEHDSDADLGPNWKALLASDPIGDDRSSDDLDALASINYTSGSSGAPKGVMLTHRNWRGVTRNMLVDRRISGDDVLAHVGPLTHASGTYFAPFFLRGATSVIVDGSTTDDLLGAIEQHRVTGFTCVPTVLTRLIRSEQLDRVDLSSLRWIGCGADSVPQNTIDATIDRLGPRLTINYGLTEAMMTVSLLTQEEIVGGDGTTARSGCIGRPYTFVDVVLRNADGDPVPAGEIGEITVRAEHAGSGQVISAASTSMD